MNAGKKKGDDYYPLRWRVADFVENIIILYRSKAALFIAALGILLVLIGLFVLGWRPWSSDEVADPIDDNVAETSDIDETGTDQPETDQSSTEETTTTALDASNTDRPIASDQEVAFTTPGTVIELGPTVMRLTGGHPSDEGAERSLAIAVDLFPDREVFDAQLLSTSFPEDETITIRIVEPTLFIEDAAELNPAFLSLFDDVADVVFSNGDFTVEIEGHDIRQRLSERRARAAEEQLIAAGVVPNIVTNAGFGNTMPIPEFASRIDFIIR